MTDDNPYDDPKEDIILGFMRPKRRHLTDFSAA